MHLRTLSDSDLVMYAIGGRDSNYNAFISYFTMQSDVVSFDEFHSKLLTYERTLEKKNSQDVNRLIQKKLAKFAGRIFKSDPKTHYVSQSPSVGGGSFSSS